MNSIELISRLLTVLEIDILTKTRDSITQGNGVFGAAILKNQTCRLLLLKPTMK